MIFLTSVQTFQLVRGETATSAELVFTCTYIDENATTATLGNIGSFDGLSNGTTPVTVCISPSIGTIRRVSGFSIFNNDTLASLLTIQLNDNATARTIWKGLLLDGDTLFYSDLKGFYVINSSGELRVAVSNIQGGSSSSGGSTVPIHATTHEAGGDDPIPLDTLAAPSDVTTLNASTSKHGLLAKLSGTASNFLSGLGTWIDTSTITTLGTIVTGIWTATKVGLAYGGTNADLSGTGGTSKFLKQASAGATVTVVQPASSDLSDASNIPLLNAANTFTVGTQTITVSANSDQVLLAIRNTNAGSSADTKVQIGNDQAANRGELLNFSAAVGSNGSQNPDQFTMQGRGTNGVAVTGIGTVPISFYVNNTLVGQYVGSTGNFSNKTDFQTSTSSNFSWASKSVNTVYQAASDGFIVGSLNSQTITIKSDSNNPPTTVRVECQNIGLSAGIPFMCPVKKSDYYKVDDGGSGAVFQTGPYWVPLGVNG